VRAKLKRPLPRSLTNQCSAGDVPLELRNALIVPLFNMGIRSEPGNYRPASLTSALCKVMDIHVIINDNIVEQCFGASA